MTSETLALVAGTLLSLLFSHVPGFSTWYEPKDSQTKAFIMAVLLLVVAGVSYWLGCASPYQYFECSETGFWAAARVFLMALVANQGTHEIAKHLPGA